MDLLLLSLFNASVQLLLGVSQLLGTRAQILSQCIIFKSNLINFFLHCVVLDFGQVARLVTLQDLDLLLKF